MARTTRMNAIKIRAFRIIRGSKCFWQNAGDFGGGARPASEAGKNRRAMFWNTLGVACYRNGQWNAWMEKNRPNDNELHHFRAEAASLIERH